MRLVAALAAVAVVVQAQPEPVACPKGTERRGDAPPDGSEQWCEGHDSYGFPRREGPYRAWYDDGGVRVEQTFTAGEVEGRFVERHRNGKPAREGAYVRGRKAGTWRVFYESGALEEQSEWRDGVAHGAFAAYWPGGARRTEGRFCGGAQCGRWRTWDSGGTLVGEVDYGEQKLVP